MDQPNYKSFVYHFVVNFVSGISCPKWPRFYMEISTSALKVLKKILFFNKQIRSTLKIRKINRKAKIALG